MPRSAGTYSPPAGQPVVVGTVIDATVFNTLVSDLGNELTNSLPRDGTAPPTANTPMGGFKLTGLGAATARTDAASLANIQDGTGVYVATVAGTADVITIAPNPAITAYATGQLFSFIASGANTTNVTVNISGLGAKAVTKNGSTALAAGDIPSGFLATIRYDGTRFQLIGSVATAGATAPFADTTAIVKGSSDATKLVRIEADGLTTATTRVLTAQDADGTIAYVNSQVFTGTPTLPTGTIATTQSVGDSSTKLATTAFVQANKLTNRTALSLASGTTKDFGSIPAINRIVGSIHALSTNGTSNPMIQIGTGGTPLATGYLGAESTATGATTAQFTTGFIIKSNTAAAGLIGGSFELDLIDAATNTWEFKATMARSDTTQVGVSAGTVVLSGALDIVRLTMVNGTDAFDSASGLFGLKY